ASARTTRPRRRARRRSACCRRRRPGAWREPTAGRRRGWVLRVVVGAERLADPLCERLSGQLGLLAFPTQLLDRDVARGVHLGARDDPSGAILVPDPDVFHLQVEEGIAGLGMRLEIESVAEVGRVLREHAVAKQWKDRRVLLLQLELELRLELVELVEVRHG